MGLFRGLWAPFRGGAFIVRHRLWGYVLLPLVINVGVAIGSYRLATQLVARFFPHLEGLGGTAAGLLVAVLVFLALHPVINAPFIDLLTERAERIARGSAPSVGFVTSIARSLWHGLLKSALYALGLGVTVTLSVTTGAGAVAGAMLTGVFLAYDGFDYPLARRAVGFGGKWAYLCRHPAQTIGYAAAALFCYSVPLALFVAPPIAAVGATLAYLDRVPAVPGAKGQPT